MRSYGVDGAWRRRDAAGRRTDRAADPAADNSGGATTAVAPPRDNWLAAKVALSGLVGGVVASGVAATPGLHRWLITPIRSVLFAAAVTAGAAIFYNKGGRFLGWLFGCVAVAHFAASTAGFFISTSLPRDAVYSGYVSAGFVITWLLIPICVFGALALRFRSFRHGRVWFAALMVGLLIGVWRRSGSGPAMARWSPRYDSRWRRGRCLPLASDTACRRAMILGSDARA